VRQAIFEAINLANNAADKLAAPTMIEPGKRDPIKDKVAIQTANFFRAFFCHDPTRRVPWDDNDKSGVSVAKRFRAVAKNLGGPEARRITFRCDPACDPCTRAHTNQHDEPDVINLCALFWNPPPAMPGLPPEGFRGGVILHEMLHVLYTDFFHHDANEHRRNNAHCFRAFALRAKGYGQDQVATVGCATSISLCTGKPC
jgi:hypothetical protein